ncbi:hypothetical protein BJF83_06220 [Nocardiopsis sp. CNR-923]|uniref:DUF4233 domain-containing protein n=1 Tax=Nocardiopsis sp. CNR-923 TaxID=1904965 RepID=UPI00096065AB|nr:DUF4233 domain-containing protein [Nocardiopsis sp. CNR-923]OLT25039.1 hypothetical protein BJF83_06220 [Nocardiopsis sp. CNR-923]
MRVVCAVVLAFEVIILGLAIPIAVNVEGIDTGLAAGVWGGLAAAALVLSALQRFTWAHYTAWVLQAVMLATSFLVSGMLLISVVFAALWVVGVLTGHRVDAARAAHAARSAAEGAEAAAATAKDGTGAAEHTAPESSTR